MLVSVARQTEFARIGGGQADAADVRVRATREALEARMNGQPGEVAIEGDAALFDRWLALHDSFDLWFEIATP